MTGAQQRISAGPLTAEAAESLNRVLVDADGQPLGIFAVLAHHPPLLRRVAALGAVFLGDASTLSPRDRELVTLRVAAVCDSDYERAQHTIMGRAAGLRDDELARVAEHTVDGWPVDDRTLLAFTDALLATADVDEPTWNAAAQRFTAAQLIELILLIGYYRMLAGFLRSARIPVDATIDLNASGEHLA